MDANQMLKSIQFEQEVHCVKELNDYLIVAGLNNGEIQIYDLNKMEIIQTISAHSSYVYRLLLSNGNLLSSSEKGKIKLWQILP